MDDMQAQLPEEPNSFVGRECELGELSQLLGQTRALTMCGPAGIGKTRLALRLLAAAAGELPDGAWLVELGDRQQSELVVSRVAAAIGVSEEAGRPLLDTLADALRSRRLLLAGLSDWTEGALRAPGGAARVRGPGLSTVRRTGPWPDGRRDGGAASGMLGT